MDIRMHIENLVLEGLPIERRRAAQVRAAVEAELARLLAEGGISAELQSGGALPSAPARAIAVDSKPDPAGLGRQIAQSVYSGIGRPQELRAVLPAAGKHGQTPGDPHRRKS
jgi:hypothetical protein